MRLPGLSALFLVAATAFADPFGPPKILTTTYPDEASIAHTPTQTLVLWREGAVLTASGYELTQSAKRAAVAAVGERGVVVWTEADGDVMVNRVTNMGALLGPVFRIASNAAGPIAIAGGDDRYIVAWPSTLGDVYAAVLDAFGTPIVPAMPVTTQSQEIGEIAAASTGKAFAIVWHVQSPSPAVFATTLDEVAVPVSMTPLLVSDLAAFADVATDGQTFFVVWSGSSGLRARTLARDGSLGAMRRLTTNADFAPRVAWDGSAYTIAFGHPFSPMRGFIVEDLQTARFSAAGVLVEFIYPGGGWFPIVWDIAARDGHVDLVNRNGDGLILLTAAVDTVPPPARRRAVRQ